MMEIPQHVRSYWAEYQSAADAEQSRLFYDAFRFGDNEDDANALASLVLRGIKRATASLLWSYEAPQKPLPVPGSVSVVTNWARHPLCVMKTEKVTVVAYDEVTEDFAATEGEGNRTLTYWRRVHWSYFGRECARIGKTPNLKMPVVCEEFSVVYGGAS